MDSMYADPLVDGLERRLLGQTGPGGERFESPADLAQYLDPTFRHRPHVDYMSFVLASALEDVLEGENRKVTISMPPRSGKSLMSALYFPTWALHRVPDAKVIFASHESQYATSWGRAVRRLIEYRGDELGLSLVPDLTAASEWETTEGGGMLSRGVGGSLTGRGAKIMILDDIVKDHEQAHSETHREAAWNWWQSVALTRLEPPYLVVAIGTRWHEDDFLGRLLAAEDRDEWEQIMFPALAVPGDDLGRDIGEPLYSPLLTETREQALARWQKTKAQVGSMTWDALYQQDPQPSGGALFDPKWWRYYDRADLEDLTFERVVTSWDMAFKDTKSSDWVVGQRWGVIGADRYLIDQVRGKWDFVETARQFVAFAENTREHFVEDKANGTAVLSLLKSKVSGLIPITPREGKEARARAISPQVEGGNVYLPRWQPWLGDLTSELTKFPNGKHDDQVDALTQALNRLQPAGVSSIVVPGHDGFRMPDRQRNAAPRMPLRRVS